MQVEHRKRFAGEDHLVVVQPDGTLALRPSAYALGCLSKGWSSCASESMRFSPLEAGYGPRVKEAIMQPRHRLQRDLFEKDRRTPDIPTSQRGILARLIQGLLVEAISGASSETRVASTQTKEVAHEQDHA